MEKLVSIISPCYNGGKYLIPFMESILNQDYTNIEFIIVDDGSTDNSKDIILSYEDKLKDKGYSFKYIYQENNGAASAINKGLKIFSGDYLMWVDSDDVLLENNVSEKVKFLENNKEYGFVLGQGQIVSENDYKKEIGILKRTHGDKVDDLFQDLIYERNVIYGPGTVMATREAILKAIPTRKIYESKQGQNWQLILPLAYYFKCGYIEKPLFKCVTHSDSHSRKERSIEEILQRIDGFIEILSNTIYSIVDMSDTEKKEWVLKIERKYAHRRLKIYYENRLWNPTKEEKRKLKKLEDYTYKDTYLYYVVHLLYMKIRGKLRNLI